MEAFRGRLMMNSDRCLVPLGKKRGILQESFAQTSFKVAPQPSLETKKSSGSNSSNDDLDFLSQITPPPSSSMDSPKSNVKGKKVSRVLKSPPKRIGPRPKARMVGSKAKPSFTSKSSASVIDKFDDILDMPPSNQSVCDSPDPISSPLEELSQNTVMDQKKLRGNAKKKYKAEIEAFPMDVDKIKRSRGVKRLTGDKPSTLSPSPSKKSKASHKSPSKKPELAPFPMDIPKKNGIPKKKQPSIDSESDDDLGSVKTSPISYGGLRPFPMSLNDIIRKPSNFPKFPEYTPIKPAEEFTMGAGPSKSNVDPSKLCPYCDEPMPDEPSPKLRDLLKAIKKKSRKDPRPGNPLGLIASVIVFAEVCERHRLEMNYIPLAISQGWPTKIDFVNIPNRIQTTHKESLDGLVANPESSSFWRELRKDAAALGRKKLASLTGLYATFEKSQPGYYGEQGSFIIQQTLYSLFPDGSISEEAVEPLTVEQFLSQVLLPETATLLIMEDMNLTSKAEALEVLEESKRYGIAMFPERQDGAAADVGERLAMERALTRRKYLREIGETEEDIAREIIEEEKKKGPASQQENRKSTIASGWESDAESSSHKSTKSSKKPKSKKTVQQKVDLDHQTPKPKPKPRPKPKIQSRDYIEVDDATETPRAVSTKIREKALAVLSDLSSLSSDDDPDVSWKANFRGDALQSPGLSSTKMTNAALNDALDMTPRPVRNLEQKAKGSASKTSDKETALKRPPRPKPRPVMRKPEFVTGEAVPDSLKENEARNKEKTKAKKDDYNWLLED